MPKTKRTPRLEHLGSLITYRDGERDRCLGYLLHVPEHGTFDPTLCHVDVSKEDADTHNKCLSRAEIDGLDKNCQIGQCGMFYYHPGPPKQVKTWIGDLVSDKVRCTDQVVTFERNGMVFRGRKHKDPDDQSVSFRRVK